MMAEAHVLPNFIIAGTPKAGTSSIFHYLVDHPQVCGSSVKESLFFHSDEFSGKLDQDIARYSKYFEHYGGEKIIMEATPSYLARGSAVARRIHKMLPNVKLLFILRNPVDRLYSYYNYKICRLAKDFEIISFDDFVDECMRYSGNGQISSRYRLDEQALKSLDSGKYAQYLREYSQVFSCEQIKIMFYEDMRDNLNGFMAELCGFLVIDASFYDNYTFPRVNETFEPKLRVFHRVALSANEKLERFFRHHRSIKNRMVSYYKLINRKQGYLPMQDATRKKLEEYYSQSNRELKKLLKSEQYPSWLK